MTGGSRFGPAIGEERAGEGARLVPELPAGRRGVPYALGLGFKGWGGDQAVARRCGEEPVDQKDGKGIADQHHAHPHGLGPRIGGIGGDELWQEGQEKQSEFGVEQVDDDSRFHDGDGRWRCWRVFQLQRVGIAPCKIGQIKQTACTGEAQRLIKCAAGVQEGREAQSRGKTPKTPEDAPGLP